MWRGLAYVPEAPWELRVLLAVWTLGKVADRSPEMVALVTREESALPSCWTVSLPHLPHGGRVCVCPLLSTSLWPQCLSLAGRRDFRSLAAQVCGRGRVRQWRMLTGASEQEVEQGRSHRWGPPLKPPCSQLVLPVEVLPKFPQPGTKQGCCLENSTQRTIKSMPHRQQTISF